MISARTRLLAVLGDPVGHSLSPTMHNRWLAADREDAVYLALRAPLEQAAQAMRGLAALGAIGANVTVPLKEVAAEVADTRDETVAALGAANVLKIENGRVAAFNTDADGFVAALDEARPEWRDVAKSALVIGAGGAARAIGHGLAKAGLKRVAFVNRTQARAEEAAARIPGAHVQDWADLAAAFAQADLIINATSLGLAGGPSPEWPFAAAPAEAIAVDAVYRPLATPFLLAAEARGLASVDGLGMLIHQGALAYQIWFGRTPDTQAARAALIDALQERQA